MWLWWFKLPFSTHTILLTLLSLITTVGFASLGYFINEFFDKASDAKAGKLNKLTFLSPQLQAAVFLSAVVLTFIPWVWLPSTALSWLLIGMQILLFLVYSLPFPRLKESTYLSIVIDSLYAYLVPLVLSFYTFSLIAGVTGIPAWFYLFGASVFFIGLRNIIIHQVNDVMKDKQSGIMTLPLVSGVQSTKKILLAILLYEAFFGLLSIVALMKFNLVVLVYGFICFSIALRAIRIAMKSDFDPQRDDLFINWSYLYFFPLFTLVAAGVGNPFWLLLLPLHLTFLFPHYLIDKAILHLRRNYYKVVVFVSVEVRDALSKMVNYPLYYAFKLFGIDLKKENKSAADVLLGKRKK